MKNPPYLHEVDQVLPHCDARHAALMLLCAHAGLRVSEALALTTADVHGASLTVRGKGGRVRRVPLGRSANMHERRAALSVTTAERSLPQQRRMAFDGPGPSGSGYSE